MNFELRIVPPHPSHGFPSDAEEDRYAEYDAELDDVSSVIDDIFGVLESRGYGFVARVWDDAPWPVSLRPDLAVVLEQLPDVFAALTLGRPCSIDFYEQGIERLVVLSPTGQDVAVERIAARADTGDERREGRVARDVLDAELRKLVEDVLLACRGSCPLLAAHPWFESWAARLEASARVAGEAPRHR